MCKSQKLSPSDKNTRQRVAYAMKRQDKLEWIGNANIDLHTPSAKSLGSCVSRPILLDLDADNDINSSTDTVNGESVGNISSNATIPNELEEAVDNQMNNSAQDAASGYSQKGFIERFSAINISNN
jgi:hypothetical protein